jgi:hypothetical protein
MVLLVFTALLGGLFTVLLTWNSGPVTIILFVPLVSSLLTLAASLLLHTLRSIDPRRYRRASIPPPEVIWC